MTPTRFLICAAIFGGLGACAAPDTGPAAGAEGARMQLTGPPGAAPGTCWGRYVSPAVIETVTHQVVVRPAKVAADGTVTAQAVYRSESSQEIVRDRRDNWFRTPCEAEMTGEFIASVQRALAVRGFYGGAITGQMDAATRSAVRRYQEPQGLDTAILSRDAARRLGLVAVDRDDGS